MSLRGADHPRWKGGRRNGGGGGVYILVNTPDRGETLEHRLVMEQAIGRRLIRGEVVHHLNHNTKDNRLENLQLLTASEHARLHYRENLAHKAYRSPPAVRRERSCEQCGDVYEAIGKKELGRRFCSKPCYYAYRAGRGQLS